MSLFLLSQSPPFSAASSHAATTSVGDRSKNMRTRALPSKAWIFLEVESLGRERMESRVDRERAREPVRE